MAARTQLARIHLLVADIEEKKRLDRIDFALIAPVQLVLDYVEQLAMQPFNEIQGLEIVLTKRGDARKRRRSLRFSQCCHLAFTPAFAGPTCCWSKTRPDVLRTRKMRASLGNTFAASRTVSEQSK